jgi:hypothetical protein
LALNPKSLIANDHPSHESQAVISDDHSAAEHVESGGPTVVKDDEGQCGKQAEIASDDLISAGLPSSTIDKHISAQTDKQSTEIIQCSNWQALAGSKRRSIFHCMVLNKITGR